MTNTSSGSLQLFHICMEYGMRLLHASKDFFGVKNPVQVARVGLRKLRIHNLKSIYDASLPEVKTFAAEKKERRSGKWSHAASALTGASVSSAVDSERGI